MEDQKPAVALSSIISGLEPDRVVVDNASGFFLQDWSAHSPSCWQCQPLTAHSSVPLWQCPQAKGLPLAVTGWRSEDGEVVNGESAPFAQVGTSQKD